MASIRWAVISGSKAIHEIRRRRLPSPSAQDDGLGPMRGLAYVLKLYLVAMAIVFAAYLAFLILR